MGKFISLALLVGGIALMIYGINATNSFSSAVSRLFTGSPTARAVWILAGGAVVAAIGFASMLRSFKQD